MLLLFSLMFLSTPPLQVDPVSFKHFKKDGIEQYCLVDYTVKQIHCVYKTKQDCGNALDDRHAQICFPRKSLKIESENEQ